PKTKGRGGGEGRGRARGRTKRKRQEVLLAFPLLGVLAPWRFLNSSAQRQHPLDRQACALEQHRIHLDARLEITKREIDLFERVALHVGALVARRAATALVGIERDERLARGELAHL